MVGIRRVVTETVDDMPVRLFFVLIKNWRSIMHILIQALQVSTRCSVLCKVRGKERKGDEKTAS